MKRFSYIFSALLTAFGLVLGIGAQNDARASTPLTKMDFTIVGVSLSVGPEYQAVPKGIASQVTTSFMTGGQPLASEVLAMLPADLKVLADLTGPTISQAQTLVASAGQPFQLPSFPVTGKYALSNIRLVDATGKAIMAATPTTVTIESISDPLVTSVVTRQLPPYRGRTKSTN